MVPLSLRIGFAVVVASAVGTLSRQPAASAARPRAPVADEVLQALADVVLVESRCRQVEVDYGRLFAFAERNGVNPVEIMPLGDRRAAFDAVYLRRAREMPGKRLCDALVQMRDATIPGVFTIR